MRGQPAKAVAEASQASRAWRAGHEAFRLAMLRVLIELGRRAPAVVLATPAPARASALMAAWTARTERAAVVPPGLGSRGMARVRAPRPRCDHGGRSALAVGKARWRSEAQPRPILGPCPAAKGAAGPRDPAAAARLPRTRGRRRRRARPPARRCARWRPRSRPPRGGSVTPLGCCARFGRFRSHGCG